MNTCAICRNRFEADSPAVLFISAYGAKRVLCPSCEALLDQATVEGDTPEKNEALTALGELAGHMKDPEVFEALGAILSGKVDDENAPTPEEEAEMEAVFEEIEKEEAEMGEKEVRGASFLDYLTPALFGVALAVFLVWFFFFR